MQVRGPEELCRLVLQKAAGHSVKRIRHVQVNAPAKEEEPSMSISPGAPRWIRRQNRVAAHSCPVLPLRLRVKLTARDRQRGPSCGESK
jgi:hypothetical protein